MMCASQLLLPFLIRKAIPELPWRWKIKRYLAMVGAVEVEQ